MTPYQNFASLYDQLMKDAPYEKWVGFTNEIIEHRPVQTIVDLGCGTGEITLRLATPYRRLFGVDFSANMLAIAEQKSLERRAHVTWVKQDIRSLSGFSQVDLVISYCDVINYIVDKADVQRVFKKVYHSLSPNGLFIFDVHSLAHVKNNLQEETFAYTEDDLAYIWHCSSGDHDGEMYHDMTFFYKNRDDDQLYRRIEESHHQRTYPVETYKQMLRNAQFEQIEVHSDFSTDFNFSEETSERIFIIAKK